MRKKTLALCLGIPQILLLMHLLDALSTYITKNDFPLLLYQACINPQSDYSIPFHQLLPFQLVMMYIYVAIMAYTNVYLYIFLK